MNLLLLSKSALLLSHLREILIPDGHMLSACAEISACVEALGGAMEHRPDVVLLSSPRGIAACEGFTSAAGRPKVLLLSPDPRQAEPAEEAGALFLRIPFTPEELRKLLQVASRKRKLILLCDDSTLIHRHTAPILSAAGYEVVSALHGAEGLEKHEELRPDLVITDVEMPHLDGYSLCKALKARAPRLPVIMCSTLGEAHDVERGFDAGADDYLVKPAQPDELLSRIKTLLSQSHPGLPSRERILVVDDSSAIRHLIVESLRRQGFVVISAEDGEAGLLRARAERPDMIITDYDMPRMTGFEMVHALKGSAETRDIPIMMLTARDTRRDQAQMRAVGLTAYLVKPFSVDKCVALVERILAEKRLLAYKEASRLYISQATVHAAEQAAQSGDVFAVRAKEQVAAVLFSDISGFTSMSSQKSPREVVDLLNSFFDVLCPVIREEGGDIDKFIGDAIMAVFEEQPDLPGAAPLQAVRAALRMQEALTVWARTTGHSLRMRIGINTGPVVRGDIGSRHVRRDYTVIGDVVNRAQRYESNAPVGGVLIGESTYLAVRDLVRCEARPGIRLKGLAEPVNAYIPIEILPAGENP